MIGETIGKYRIVARLGRGGMGTVYKAVDQTLEREVAIKVLNPGLTDSDLLKRFRAEAIALARLNHPNIATLYELGQHGDELLMVMEFVRGETFDKLSERVGPMPFERAAYLTAQVLDALAHAHRAGIVHRDMKPANLMLSESGVVKVMDFGIARMVGSEHLTNDGFMIGTPAYMAPEQVMGNEVDGRADLYSVGVILFRMLTGHLPFKADTAIAMVQKQIKDAPTPLRQFRAELPAWCEQILDRALAKPPESRYQTADEFRSALMLSAALAPATEVTSVLASGSMPPDLEITVAPDSMPAPLGRDKLPPPTAVPPRVPAAKVPPSAPAAPVVMPAPVFTPIAEPQATPGFRAANPTAAAPRTGQARASNRAYAGLLVVFVAAVVAAVLVVTLRRPSLSDTPAPPPSSPAPVTPAPAPEAASAQPPAVTAPAPAPTAVPPPSAADGSKPPTSPPGAAPPSRGSSTAARESSAPSGARGPSTREDAGSLRAGPSTRVAADSLRADPARGARPVLPPMTFTRVRHLVVAGGRPSEREGSLMLGSDALVVAGQDGSGGTKSVPYSSVIAIFHSRSREPQWAGPTGAALPIVKMDGGMFGFMKGDRDWVSVRTKAEFVMLRLDGPLVARVLEAIEARTGLTTVRVGKRGDSKD